MTFGTFFICFYIVSTVGAGAWMICDAMDDKKTGYMLSNKEKLRGVLIAFCPIINFIFLLWALIIED